MAVKRNEAKMTMVKVDNGIKLYKMQLAQYCGLPIEEDYEIADKDLKDIPVKEEPKPSSDEVKNNRPELKVWNWLMPYMIKNDHCPRCPIAYSSLDSQLSGIKPQLL